MLTFDQLRAANQARIPQFNNKHGKPVHSHPKGHDWKLADWFLAMVGEVGEAAALVLRDENAATEHAVFMPRTYETTILRILMEISHFLTIRKAKMRGDEGVTAGVVQQAWSDMLYRLGALDRTALPFTSADWKMFDTNGNATRAFADELADIQGYLDHTAARVGIDLGKATVDKFNEVSDRVGAATKLKVT